MSKKTVTATVNLDEESKKKLEALAKEEGRSVRHQGGKIIADALKDGD